MHQVLRRRFPNSSMYSHSHRCNSGCFMRSHCNHDPRKHITKDLPGDNPGPRENLEQLMAWLHKVDRDAAMARPQHAGSDPDNPGEGRRIADRPDAFRAVAIVRTEVFTSTKHSGQWLAFLG